MDILGSMKSMAALILLQLLFVVASARPIGVKARPDVPLSTLRNHEKHWSLGKIPAFYNANICSLMQLFKFRLYLFSKNVICP